ncbi:MAG: STAS domain-containing protein [Gammaproteobacteria bacterium]|nr:STAS domain-containing protein [Gammaproteobacteria bacterium]
MPQLYELPDEITISTVREFYQTLMERMEQTEEGEVLQVDAAEVHRFDGAGLQCLFQLWQTRQLVVLNPTDELSQAAQMMGLSNEFLVH